MATSSYKTVPLSVPDQSVHLRRLSLALNNTIAGKINSTGSATLTASATTTTLTDERIGSGSIILFMPTTANASTAYANLYVSARIEGSATLTHSSSANTDQTFGYVIFG